MGARKIAVVGLPPVGCLPSQRTLAGGITRECVEFYNQIAKLLNYKLSNKIELLSAKLSDPKIIYVDIYTILDNLLQRPFDYGNLIHHSIIIIIICNDILEYGSKNFPLYHNKSKEIKNSQDYQELDL